MSINLGTEENPLIAYVSVTGGFVDAIVRAPTVEAFEAAAKAAEMLYEVMETVTDPETGEMPPNPVPQVDGTKIIAVVGMKGTDALAAMGLQPIPVEL